MFLWICEFLRQIYQELFEHRDALIELTQKNKPFTWSSSAVKAFENLERAFTSSPILLHVDLENPL